MGKLGQSVISGPKVQLPTTPLHQSQARTGRRANRPQLTFSQQNTELVTSKKQNIAQQTKTTSNMAAVK